MVTESQLLKNQPQTQTNTTQDAHSIPTTPHHTSVLLFGIFACSVLYESRPNKHRTLHNAGGNSGNHNLGSLTVPNQEVLSQHEELVDNTLPLTCIDDDKLLAVGLSFLSLILTE